ncbi:MAG: OmpH family outer membrane protein [Desulfobacterales bacterium]|nr:OmpH family outer membrane protein [Desulfobacterales bacterium]
MQKRIFTIFLMVAFFSTFFVGATHAADVAKIGIVDFMRLFEKSAAGKAATAEFNKQGKKREGDLKARAAEIEELKKRLERESLVMSKENREDKEREIKIKVYDFNALQKKYAQELRNLEKRIKKRIRDEIFVLVEKIGKEGGYLLIMEKHEAGVIYFPNSLDITDDLIKRYNEHVKSAVKGAGKTE